MILASLRSTIGTSGKEELMESHAKMFGHPIHQMLVVFPLGLLAMAVIFDAIGLMTDTSEWSAAAYRMIAAGILSALIAAPFGVIDWMAIPKGTRAKRIGALHGGGNLLVIALFAVSWWLRGDPFVTPTATTLTFSFTGAALALGTGWLGGELVDRLAIGVDDGAHADAPSSLRARRVRA
jgi:uncharacterized membrane protein